jgi:hypothetical protein
MKCLRIYATLDGESHFDEVDIPATEKTIFPDTVPFKLSATYPSSCVRFTHIPANVGKVDWHTVPERVLVIRLNGGAKYQTSDGQVRHVPAGGMVLVEDTHGKGHLSRHSEQEQVVIWVTVPNGLDRMPPASPLSKP